MQKTRVAKYDDLKNGEMKEVSVGDTSVLLVRIADQYHALYGKCTHYGAPLADGALDEESCRLVCPWHHACFDIRTGKHLEAPGLDGLPTYGVEIEDGAVYVTVPEPDLDRQPNQMVAYHPSDKRKYLIVGGGAAAAYAIEGLREAGFKGHIEVITREKEWPYDRPNCSKEYLADEAEEAWMPLRDEAFYEDLAVQFRLGSEVVRLDADQHELELHSGEKITYDKVLLCTGGAPRKLGLNPEHVDNVFYLRSLADSRAIREAGKNATSAVVIGASFIGLEGAASLQKLGVKKVQVVGPESVPFGKLFGHQIGSMIKRVHQDTGIRFFLGQKAKRIEAENGKVRAVILDNDTALAADLVLIGAGVQPLTDYIEGLPKEKDDGLRVNAFMEVGKDVYAAGDIAHFTYRDELVRIEHWKTACQQGRVAAFNMAGKSVPFQTTPFFWTAQQDLKLRYLGHAEDYDEVVIDGSVEEQDFIAYYRKNGEDMAVLACGRDREIAEIDAIGRL